MVRDEPHVANSHGSWQWSSRRPGVESREREFAILEGELQALGKDIAAARAASARAQAPMGLSAHREPPAPRLSGERIRLPDGTEIVVRPIEADDAPLLRLTLEHLSALSRYRRFREPVDHFSPRELDEITHADHRTREALVALDPVAGEGIGIAGYVRDAHDPKGAEVTFLVTDAWQSRGVGTAPARAAGRPGAGGRAGALHGDDARGQRGRPPAARPCRRPGQRAPRWWHRRNHREAALNRRTLVRIV